MGMRMVMPSIVGIRFELRIDFDNFKLFKSNVEQNTRRDSVGLDLPTLPSNSGNVKVYLGVSTNSGKTLKMDGFFHGKPY